MSAQIGPQWRIAQAERIREAMGPEMCEVADALRETFGAKLTWLETSTLNYGAHPGGEPIGEKSYLAVCEEQFRKMPRPKQVSAGEKHGG